MLFLSKKTVAAGGAFTPADLFASGETGAWYDPSDLSTLWQDTGGTVAVTADGQSVARVDDKSGNGNNLTQTTASKRPVYKTDGTLHWLLFDGVDDVQTAVVAAMAAQTIAFSAKSEAASGSSKRFFSRKQLSSGSQAADIFDNNGTWGWFANEAGGVSDLGGDCRTSAQVVTVKSSSASTATGWVDGVEVLTFDPHDIIASGDRVNLASETSAGGQFLNCKHYGFVNIDRVISVSEQDDLESHLANKAGV